MDLLSGSSFQGSLHPAMLVTEGDLQVEDRLPVALEPEVSRLDHSRMDRAHGHFVDFFPLDAKELRFADFGMFLMGGRPAAHPALAART